MPGLPARGRDRGMAPWTTNAKPHDNRGASQNRHVSVASFVAYRNACREMVTGFWAVM